MSAAQSPETGSNLVAAPVAGPAKIVIAKIEVHHLRQALREGWQDFMRAPQFGLFFGVLYAAGGWAIVLLSGVSGYFVLAYPLAAGFALIAPFIAAALYEVSRQLEQAQPVSWGTVMAGIRSAGGRDLGWMALVTCFAFFIWVDIAVFLYAMFFGLKAPSTWALLTEIFTTTRGMMFFVLGNAIGAVIALFIFSITVVSFPLLLDRDCDFVTAMITSMRAVRENMRVMLTWAVIIAALMMISFATALAALVIVLPWLAHATWRLYRLTVPRAP